MSIIFETPILNDQEVEVIGRIGEMRQSLKYSLGMPQKKWYGLLRRSIFGRAIRGSNSIEGYNVSDEDAVAAIERQEPLEAQRETWQAITGYRDAMTYVLQLSDAPHFSYSEGLLSALHYMMLQHDFSKNPGRWRPGYIAVRSEQTNEIVYEGPDADLIPKFIAALIEELNQNDNSNPVMVRAAMGHLNLVTIHPFSDGNGRMARCLQTLILAREGILRPAFSSVEEYLGRFTLDYYEVLAQVGGGSWHPNNDARPWIRFCLKAHYRQAKTLIRRVKEIDRLWGELEREINDRGLPDRTIFALAEAAGGRRIRNATYRPIAEISENVASRDLKQLVDSGLLVPNGERRGRYYTASELVLAIREKTREPRIAPENPFDLKKEGQAELFKS